MPRSASDPPRLEREHGAGLIASAAGVLVFLVFLTFAVQLLFGLYATSMVTAVAADATQRAAAAQGASLEVIEADARASLGRVGDTATFRWSTEDTDADGIGDTIVLAVTVNPPRLVPASIGDATGFGEISRTARARVEQLVS